MLREVRLTRGTTQSIKGCAVYRGDSPEDEDGATEVCQNLSATATSIIGINANIATTNADAVKAYVQATLNSKFLTQVVIPRELHPKVGDTGSVFVGS